MTEERGVPEDRPGAEPGDEQIPDFSRGEPLDEAQPSARRRPELDTEESTTDDADVRTPEESF